MIWAKQDKQAEMEMEMEIEFSLASTIHQNLLQYPREMRGRVSRISSFIKFKAIAMELRSTLYGASLQGSSSQLIQRFITSNCVAMSNQARTFCQTQSCLVYSRSVSLSIAKKFKAYSHDKKVLIRP